MKSSLVKVSLCCAVVCLVLGFVYPSVHEAYEQTMKRNAQEDLKWERVRRNQQIEEAERMRRQRESEKTKSARATVK